MTLVNVYRIEGRTGEGPYMPGSQIPGIMSAHSGPTSTPGPARDGLGEMDGDEFCGFRSLAALSRWFTTEGNFLKRARHHGGGAFFALVVDRVDISHVRYGKRQLVYRKGEIVSRRNFRVPAGPVRNIKELEQHPDLPKMSSLRAN